MSRFWRQTEEPVQEPDLEQVETVSAGNDDGMKKGRLMDRLSVDRQPVVDVETKHMVMQLAAKVDTLAAVAKASGSPPPAAAAAPVVAAPQKAEDEEDANSCSCSVQSASSTCLVFVQVLLFILLVIILGLVGANHGLATKTYDEVQDAAITKTVTETETVTVTEMYYAETASTLFSDNLCDGAGPGFPNIDCADAIVDAIEQSGANVTEGYVGEIDNSATPPLTVPYYQAGLCPVNVHWHLGTEHLSVGEYDNHGTGPEDSYAIHDDDHRRLAEGGVRMGFQCHHYDSSEEKFTKAYDWEHCTDMMVGQTYEIHWPHSTVGACGTPYQYQTPFYDGVFCNYPAGGATTHDNVGVQSQTFVIVNDEDYYYPDLLKGMIVSGDFGSDMAYYTGSTTGTSRDNEICSQYSPITWQVDRKCHMISASSFDKMCADMKAQVDDMSDDLYPHGSRKLVADELASAQETR